MLLAALYLMASVHMDDKLRGTLYDRTGMNFFVCEIDGEWRAGWFRIDGSQLEVSSENRRRTVTIIDSDLLTDLLRKVLTEIANESRSDADAAQRRAGQKLAFASLHCRRSLPNIASDSAREREQ